MPTQVRTARRRRTAAVGVVVGALLAVVLAFTVHRFAVDTPHLVARTVPDDPFDRRYVLHALPAYLHLAPGAVFLLGAPLQLSRRLRARDQEAHGRRGRVLVGAGVLSGVFAVAFGVPHAFGGASEAAAALVFGTWFAVALVLGLRAARRHDAVAHRDWMVRAFAVAVGVGTIRLWVGVLAGIGPADLPDAFGAAFWLGLGMHAVATELWLRVTPPRAGRRRR